MKILKNISILGVALTLFTSCELDLKPKTSIALDQSFQSIEDAQNYASGMATRMRQSLYGQWTYNQDMQMDQFNAALDFGNRGGAVHQMSGSFTTGDYFVRDAWDRYYLAILSANNFITQAAILAPTLEAADAASLDQMVGMAHFYRAYYYHYIVRYWSPAYDASSATAANSGAPLVLEYDIEARPSRATLAETYAQINADLASAEAKLAGTAGAVRAALPTIDAVYALKARVALFMKDYTNAAKYADMVISSAAGYTLTNSAEGMVAQWTNDSGTEEILQLFISTSETPNAMGVYLQLSNATGTYQPDWIPTKTSIDAYEPTDIRLNGFFAEKTNTQNAATYQVMMLNKFPGNPNQYTSTSNYQNAPKVFRVAEMYLIAAEAYAQSNNPLAATRLNALQSARGASNTAATMDFIKAEWAKEMIGEGVRMDCLKRWGVGFSGRVPQNANTVMGGDVSSDFAKKTLEANSKYVTWPIPLENIETNTNLVQNTGW